MTPDAVKNFMDLIKEATAEAGEDPDAKAIGLWLQAEGYRQAELWKEALDTANECIAFEPRLGKEGKESSCIPWSHLVCAYAHLSGGKAGMAKDALEKIEKYGTNHQCYRSIDFKATHLRKLIGMEVKELYTTVKVGARSKGRLLVPIPADT